MSEKKFYVYVHLYASGPKQGEVFYVGKGKGGRASYPYRHHNPHWQNISRKYGFTPKIVMRFDNEVCAFSFERALIKHYGRENLCNLTDGGEGTSGYKWDDCRRDTMMNIFSSKEYIEKKSKSIIKSQKRPEVTKKLSLAAYKQWKDPIISNKMRISMSKAKGGSSFKCSNGMLFNTHTQAISWLKYNGFPKASQGNLAMALMGKRKTAYGYKWEYT